MWLRNILKLYISHTPNIRGKLLINWYSNGSGLVKESMEEGAYT